jgi:hypothetical protein
MPKMHFCQFSPLSERLCRHVFSRKIWVFFVRLQAKTCLNHTRPPNGFQLSQFAGGGAGGEARALCEKIRLKTKLAKSRTKHSRCVEPERRIPVRANFEYVRNLALNHFCTRSANLNPKVPSNIDSPQKNDQLTIFPGSFENCKRHQQNYLFTLISRHGNPQFDPVAIAKNLQFSQLFSHFSF